MKFSIVSFVASAIFISQVLATPAPQGSSTPISCGRPYDPECPEGYHCCAPHIIGVGGIRAKMKYSIISLVVAALLFSPAIADRCGGEDNLKCELPNSHNHPDRKHLNYYDKALACCLAAHPFPVNLPAFASRLISNARRGDRPCIVTSAAALVYWSVAR
ncbi:hypothetical protein M413DRAFT_30181 [Hebeloma cylindrosporum]|uniref:Hydrophobin n=1 Tax=Hebeloma cylindrosporum TaxID=76867 RepID=A0A0C3C229_HEBCY|nr:hypothetical protein M413DRAFT_30181 [Hebeloma cylindrosporum h7]